MASLSREPNGGWRILVVGTDRKRRPIRIGRAKQRDAEAFTRHVEILARQAKTGFSDPATDQWMAELSDDVYKKLVAVGLAKPRIAAGTTLEKFLADGLAALDVKASTLTTYGQTVRSLTGHFGATRLIRDIGPADAEQFKQALKAEKLSVATVAQRVKYSRQLFKIAVRWKLLTVNPFADVVAGSSTNRSRMFFVTEADARKVLAACPDAEWRLLFSLSRWGGLRCPSEHLALRWTDIDWAENRIRVPSPKTEKMIGGDCRTIPMFPELAVPLREAFELAPEGSEFVISRCRSSKVNLRTQLQRIIARAGLKPWAKLWHNLRATRQTELAERFPIQVVCSWIGNSEAVARAHYLQTTDQHFAAAIAGTGVGTVSGTVCTPQGQEPARKMGNEGSAISEKPGEIHQLAGRLPVAHERQLCLQGFEP